MDALAITSAIKHAGTQLCIRSGGAMCRFTTCCISFVTKRTGTEAAINSSRSGRAAAAGEAADQQLIDAREVSQTTLVHHRSVLLARASFCVKFAAENDKPSEKLSPISGFSTGPFDSSNVLDSPSPSPRLTLHPSL